MSYDLKDKDVAKLNLETNPSYYDGYTKAIVAKRNDINSRYLHVDIYASGDKVDITKFSPSMNIETPTGKHFSVNGQVDDGELYFKIYDFLLKDVGHLSCDISLYKDCTNVTLDTDGSIYYSDIKLTQSKFINQVENIGTYIFEYDGSDWKLDGDVVTLGDYGIEIGANINPIAQDKIIVSYSNYMLLTTETFFIAIQDNIYSEDAQIPTDEEGRVFDYIDANDVLVAIDQSHTHDNKDILDATTASYTTEDKTKLKNIDTSLYVEKSTMGKANGVATLDNSGLVPAGQLPSFVDDVIESYIVGSTEFASNWLSLTNDGTALTPEKGKIYIIVSEGNHKNKQYRWGGSTYVLCNPSDVNSVNGKTGVISLNLDDIPNGETNVHTANNFTNDLKNKLDGIEDGAQVNITPDWNATKEEKGYIANKPIIPEGSQLYDSTGENTDGAMTQKATTEAIHNYPATVFAESERQKSKNLLSIKNGLSDTNYGGLSVVIGNDDVITVGGTAVTEDNATAIQNFRPKIEKGKPYTLSFFDYSNLSDFTITATQFINNVATVWSVLNLTPTITTVTRIFDVDCELHISVYSATGASPTGSFKIMLEQSDKKSDEYQSYYGEIVHAGDLEDYALLGKNNIFAGNNTFNGKFVYSAMEKATSDAARHIWFNDNATPGKPVYSDNFMYNPVTNVLTCGRVAGSADFITGFTKGQDVIDWGTLKDTEKYTYVARMDTPDSGSIAFADNNQKTYMQIDGTLFVNEGNDEVYTNKGGELLGAIKMTSEATVPPRSESTPFAITYRRMQSWGNLILNANTDNSDDEPVIITSGQGVTSDKSLGLAVGKDYITWKNNPLEFTQTGVIDASSLDENTWYPVVFALNTNKKLYEIEIWAALSGCGKPSWSTHSTSGGFSVRKRWTTTGSGWGTQSCTRTIYISSYTWTDTDPVRGIGQMTRSSREYVYVRGGGIYNFIINGATEKTDVSLVTDSLTVEKETVSSTTTAPAAIKTTIKLDYIETKEINLLV